MVLINKIRGRAVEQGLNMDELAKAAGINRSTLYRKLNRGGEALTIGEALRICKVLELSPQQSNAIFFGSLVSSGENSPVN